MPVRIMEQEIYIGRGNWRLTTGPEKTRLNNVRTSSSNQSRKQAELDTREQLPVLFYLFVPRSNFSF